MNRALKRHPRRFTAATTRAGFTVDGSTADLIQRYLYLFGIWEPAITRWVRTQLRPGDVVVDIGANIGYFSLLAAGLVGQSGTVLAFEPVPSIADMLEQNISRNGLDVDVRRVAVSDHPGTIEVFRAAGRNLGTSGTAPGAGVSEGLVPCVRAADAVPPELWPRIRFVKIDVEGDEARVLSGLGPVLDAMPVDSAVLVEISPDALVAQGTSPAEILDAMAARGFTAMAIRNSYDPRDYAAGTAPDPEPLQGLPTMQTDVIFRKTGP